MGLKESDTTEQLSLSRQDIRLGLRAFLVAQMVKDPSTMDLGSISGLGRFPGGRHGNPLQYTCLENPHGQRSLAGTVHGVTKSQT